ncbi:c-type cytochrome [Mucilaginibacter myungsuensis]|nr:cytochrome c [Mucilaginibacter myungsuensis]
MNKFRILGASVMVVAATVMISSCDNKRSTGWEYAPNMYRHLAPDADQENKVFADGKTAQLPPDGTTPVGFARFDYAKNRDGYDLAAAEVKSILPQSKENFEEGKVLYMHFCSPCHGETGQGDGLVVQHGYGAPPSYSKGNSSRTGGSMKDLNDGQIYHTITYGLNSMGSYASQLSPEERWKVIMYVHHLQTL